MIKKYKGKYIVDVRDFTLENYSLYRKMEQKVLAYAYSTVISSPAYKNFLPDGDFVIAHNFSPFLEAKVEQIRNSQQDEKKDPIRISFVGTVRFIEMDKKILRLFAGDERFRIQYFGTGSQVLEKFCKEEKIENVAFYGSFTPEMTMTFYEKTDLINNLYGNHTPFLDYALSNKLYHSGQLYIPILVCPETYMQDVSLQYDMGFVFDVDKVEDKDRLYDWYRKELDFDKLARGCDNFICSVKKDNEKFSKMLANFFK